MPTIEAIIKAQFAKVFLKDDWRLFKRMAEFHLERAVFLKKSTRMAKRWRLLARNSEKRLLIGIGTELLLKAVYLKHGFSINLPEKGAQGAPPFPFTFQQIQGVAQAPDKTYMLDNLIQKVSSIPAVGALGPSEKGLKIAKVFRNKEGHSVVEGHLFDSTNYRDIETALVALYSRGFNQTLRVRFSLGPGEKGLWRVQVPARSPRADAISPSDTSSSQSQAVGPKSRESERTVVVRAGAYLEARDDLSPARSHTPGAATCAARSPSCDSLTRCFSRGRPRTARAGWDAASRVRSVTV